MSDELRDIPSIKTFQPWDTIPTPPFILVRSPMTTIFDLETLEEAVAEFARLAMPADGKMAYICDHYGVIVLGYYQRPYTTLDWIGLKVAFDLLAEQPYVEQLEVALAEMSALQALKDGVL